MSKLETADFVLNDGTTPKLKNRLLNLPKDQIKKVSRLSTPADSHD
jgi:hypothetical protein